MWELVPGDTRASSGRWAWGIVWAIYTLLGLLFAGQVRIDYAYAGVPLTMGRALAVAFADWYLWALLTPLVVWLARRVRLWPRWGRALAVHLPATVAVAAVKLAAEQTLDRSLAPDAAGRSTSFLKVYLTLMVYWVIVGATYSLEHYRKYRDRERRAAHLEAELARAQVQVLRMQLHPHFLFNTLNTISALMREDVEVADLMLTRLSELLRVTLDTAELQEVPLQQELELLDRYLDIQRCRFGERLVVRTEIDPTARTLLVPTFILQPLVENAIAHGVGARTGPALVAIGARVDGDWLHVEVRDDGAGPPTVVRTGHGLGNTRARLRELYGDGAWLSIDAVPAGGAAARMALPARPAPGTTS